MISHLNTVACCVTSKSKIKINPTDVYISYLPMAHTLERNMFNTTMWNGASIGVYGGDVLKIKDDLAILRPTIFASVP